MLLMINLSSAPLPSTIQDMRKQLPLINHIRPLENRLPRPISQLQLKQLPIHHQNNQNPKPPCLQNLHPLLRPTIQHPKINNNHWHFLQRPNLHANPHQLSLQILSLLKIHSQYWLPIQKLKIRQIKNQTIPHHRPPLNERDEESRERQLMPKSRMSTPRTTVLRRTSLQ